MLAAVPGWCFCFGVGAVVGPHSPRAYRRSARLRSPSRLFPAPARGEFPQQPFRARRTLAAVRGTSSGSARLRAGPFVASGCSGPLFALSASGAWPASFGRVPRPLRRGAPGAASRVRPLASPAPRPLRPRLCRSALACALRARRALAAAGPLPLALAALRVSLAVALATLGRGSAAAVGRRFLSGPPACAASGAAASGPGPCAALCAAFFRPRPGAFFARVRLRPLR